MDRCEIRRGGAVHRLSRSFVRSSAFRAGCPTHAQSLSASRHRMQILAPHARPALCCGCDNADIGNCPDREEQTCGETQPPFDVSLASVMAFRTPSAKVAMYAGTTPARVPFIAIPAAARAVQATRTGGTAVGLASRNGSATGPLPAGSRPRRASRCRRRFRPLDNRLRPCRPARREVEPPPSGSSPRVHKARLGGGGTVWGSRLSSSSIMPRSSSISSSRVESTGIILSTRFPHAWRGERRFS